MSTQTSNFAPAITPRRCRGTSLMEVLVSVFALSIGVLGVAGLQVTAKRSNFEATQRVTATVLAQDIIERMRANPDELGTYTGAGVGLTLVGDTMSEVDCSADCISIELAQHDLYEWEQAVGGVSAQLGGSFVGGLSLPTACVTGPDGGAGTYTVAIAWRGMTKLSNPTTHTCGEGSGRYDSPAGAEADVYRRVLVMPVFISESG
jgi:type IV pilus assembly protein PilV